MNANSFRAYVEQVLLRCLKPGDIVVMDNRPAHKVEGVGQMIQKAGARLLYLSFGAQPSAPATTSGRPSPICSMTSLHTTSSKPPDTARLKLKLL
jgi:hypothetical protein